VEVWQASNLRRLRLGEEKKEEEEEERTNHSVKMKRDVKLQLTN